GHFDASQALGVDEYGNIVGVADNGGTLHAVMWIPESGVAADYNNDGVVDAADYVYWRRGSRLHNEIATIGLSTPEDYAEWRAHFGNSKSDANTFGAAVAPEPTLFAVLIGGLLFALPGYGHRRRMA